MRETILFTAFFLALGLARPAAAQYMTGQDLLSFCNSDDSRKVYSCMYYVGGIIDYHIVMQSLGTTPTTNFCLPADLSIEEATITVMDYLKKSPQHQAFIAAPAVAMALGETFPCGKPKAKKKKK